MSTSAIVLIVIAVLVAVVLIYGIAIYNKLVSLKNAVANAFQQIDVQLQRRYDLIPNLVETAKAYLKHERETLQAVTDARNQAKTAEQQASASPTDGAAIRQLAGAEAALGGALGRLFAVMEDYPDLKADQNMRQLSEELTSTENRVAFARQAFNDAVMRYNTARESFPDLIVANQFRFIAAEGWEVAEEEAREAPKVAFS